MAAGPAVPVKHSYGKPLACQIVGGSKARGSGTYYGDVTSGKIFVSNIKSDVFLFYFYFTSPLNGKPLQGPYIYRFVHPGPAAVIFTRVGTYPGTNGGKGISFSNYLVCFNVIPVDNGTYVTGYISIHRTTTGTRRYKFFQGNSSSVLFEAPEKYAGLKCKYKYPQKEGIF